MRRRAATSFGGAVRLATALAIGTALIVARPAAASCPPASTTPSYHLVYPEDCPSSNPGALLVVLADRPTVVRIEVPACGPARYRPVAPGRPAVHPVCTAAQHTLRTFLPALQSGRTITVVRVGAEADLRVVFKNSLPPGGQCDDAYLAQPESRLGSRYRLFTWHPREAHFTALALDDLELTYEGCAVPGPQRVAMRRGETFSSVCQPANAMMGSALESDGGRLAVVSGASVARVPKGNIRTLENLWEYLPPLEPTGAVLRDYLAGEFHKVRDEPPYGDLYRVVATAADVTVAIDTGGLVTPSGDAPCPPSPFTLALPGDWCEVAITGGARFRGRNSGGFRVAQFMKRHTVTDSGDGSMMLVWPTSSFTCAHRVFAFRGYDHDPTSGANGSYLTVVGQFAGLDATLIDDQPAARICGAPEPIAGTSDGWMKCRLPSPCAPPCDREPRPIGCPASCPWGVEHTVLGRDVNGAPMAIGVYVYGQRGTGGVPLELLDEGAYSYPAWPGRED